VHLLVCSHPLVVWLQQSFDVMLVFGSSGLFLVTALDYLAHGQKSCIHVPVLHGFSTNSVLLTFK
jgi:hypothetical protein